MPDDHLDFALAHALLRLGLGTNFFLHGLVRLTELGKFSAHVEQTMAKTLLPMPLATTAGYAIPFVEILLGGLIILGLWLRPALILGALFMVVLTVGICLAQDWPVASEQLIYMIAFALLLAALRHDRYSLDRLWKR